MSTEKEEQIAIKREENTQHVDENGHNQVVESIPCIYIDISEDDAKATVTSCGRKGGGQSKRKKRQKNNIVQIDLTKGSDANQRCTYAVQVHDFRNISSNKPHFDFWTKVKTKSEGTNQMKAEKRLEEKDPKNDVNHLDYYNHSTTAAKADDSAGLFPTIDLTSLSAEELESNYSLVEVKAESATSIPRDIAVEDVSTADDSQSTSPMPSGEQLKLENEEGMEAGDSLAELEEIIQEAAPALSQTSEDPSEENCEEEETTPHQTVKKGKRKRRTKAEMLQDCEGEPTVYEFNLDFVVEYGIVEHIRKFKGHKPYQCSECSFNDTSKYRLWHHYKEHLEREPVYTCEVCKKDFNSRNSLKVHRRIHTDEKPFKCEYCFMRFRVHGCLLRHMEKHEKTKRYPCHVCGAVLGRTDTLKQHLKIHVKTKPFTCDNCNRKFVRKSALREHMRSHYDIRLFHCSHCSQTFKTKQALKRHIKTTHNNKRPHQCKVCHKSFKRHDSLKGHLRIHTNEKPYECKHCGKEFRYPKPLNTHLYKVHFKYSPFQCNYCGDFLSSNRILKRHVALYELTKPVRCKYCEDTFTFQCSFRKHMKSHVEDKKADLYRCHICGRVLCSKHSHQLHLRSCRIRDSRRKYKYRCRYCGEMFKWSYHFGVHKEQHKDEKRFKCTTCKKAFKFRHSLIIHERSHTGERPFICKLCNASFTQVGNLIRHKRSLHANKGKIK